MKLRLLLVLFCAYCSFAIAADIAPLKQNIDSIKSEITQIQASTARAGSDLSHLNTLIERLEPMAGQYAQLEEQLTPLIAQTSAKLSQLGAKPKDGESESPEITLERTTTEQELRGLEDMLKQVKLYALETEQLLTRLRAQKRDISTQSLFAPGPGLLNVTAWRDGVQDAGSHIAGLIRVSQDGASTFFGNFSAPHGLFSGLLLMVLGGLPLIRRYALTMMRRVQKAYFQQSPSISTLVAMVIYIAIPVLAVKAFVTISLQLNVLPGRFVDFAEILPAIALCLFVMRAVQFWILSPAAKPQPLLSMPSTGEQAVLRRGLFQMGILHGAALLMVGTRALVDPSDAGLWLWQMVYALAGLGIIASFFKALGAAEDAREAEGTTEVQKIPNWQLLLRPILALVFAAIAGGVVLGYPTFANFVLIQSSVVLVLMVLLWLIITSVEELAAPFTQSGSSTVRNIARTTGVPDTLIMRGATMTAGLTQLVLLIAGCLLIVAIWDADRSRIFVTLGEIFSGFKVGNLQISFAGIAQSILFFVVMVAAWRWLQVWVKQKFLAHLPLEAGLKDSLDIMFGYAGLVLAFILAFSSLGLSLENLAVIAGALSVGIGFGLQSIVNNFVSGLILLAERPIKLGDWIVVGNDEGYVRKIKVRATEIETFDKAVVIVPNSTIISGSVKNWMYNNISGRAKVRVTVKHGSDPERVKEVLLKCARSIALVECAPEPKVFFTDMNLNGLEFDLAFMVGNVDTAHSVRSELRISIIKAFQEAGIELAQSIDVRG